MEGWQQGSTSRREVRGRRGIQASFTPPRTAEVKEYAGIYQFVLLSSVLTSSKSIPGKPGVRKAENRMKLFLIFPFSLLLPESETFHGIDYWEIAEIS